MGTTGPAPATATCLGAYWHDREHFGVSRRSPCKAIGSFLPPRWTESSPPSGAGAHSSLNAGVGKHEQTARFEEMMVIFRHFLDHGHTELMLPYLEEFIKQLASNRTLSLAGSKAAKNTLNDALALHLSAAKAVVSSANASAGAEIARWITWTYFFSEDITPRLPIYAAEKALGQASIDYCVNFASWQKATTAKTTRVCGRTCATSSRSRHRRKRVRLRRTQQVWACHHTTTLSHNNTAASEVPGRC